MNRSLFMSSVAGLTVTLLATAAFAQVSGPAVFPLSADGTDIKLTFDHNNNPGPVTVPWYWHPGQDYLNVAGLKFTLKYDPYEVAILGIRPAGPDSGFPSSTATGGGPGFSGHLQHSNIVTWPESEPSGPTAPTTSTVVGTVWIPHEFANNSGITIFPSHAWPFIEVDIMARHTSNIQLNSDIDLIVSEIKPIIHVGPNNAQLLNSVWIPYHVNPTTTTTTGGSVITIPDPNYPELQLSDIVWEHHNDVLGVQVPVSNNYYPGPLPSTFSTNPNHFPISGVHPDPHIQTSNYLHVTQTAPLTINGQPVTHDGQPILPSEVYHVGQGPSEVHLNSQMFPYFVAKVSDFIIGNPVTSAVHYGLGIDHIPEPASLTLLGMSGFAAVMYLNVRRRRRRAA